jgi:hypothetical protein
MVLVALLAVANAVVAEEKKPSGTVTIDETQIMWVVGGDIGGGTLQYQGESYGFQIGGLKLGGFGVHQVKLKGDVWDLYDVGDFPGLYAAAEVGYTADDAGEGDIWLQNDKGVKLRLKSPQSEGIALDLGVEGIDIRME